MPDNPSTGQDKARREPIFENDDPREEDRLVTRKTLSDDFGGNRGMDDENKTPKSTAKRTESYVKSGTSNIDQEINQGRI
ncbi:MAG TPA: hypothetical protein PKD09_20240 [Aggregatilinea sp.]|jgi:hypothetical protein|uniref:hypothetical protein n=1 Tax=Aggregatilinea sp. TaxID=2806333 RepID=UPI002BEC7418|nr:hypothetical protein [Aggregatilinea sp.]HML23998.1 hypothetical protein [Aggregatilinea sp.]